MRTAAQFTDPCCEHGEGPVWDARSQRLTLVDMLRRDVPFVDDAGTVTRRHVASVAAALRPRSSGGCVLGIERGFALADPELTQVHPLGAPWADVGVRMNDDAMPPESSAAPA